MPFIGRREGKYNTLHTDKVAILIKKLSLEIDKLSNPILETHDLTNSQFKILKYLLTNPDSIIIFLGNKRSTSLTELPPSRRWRRRG